MPLKLAKMRTYGNGNLFFKGYLNKRQKSSVGIYAKPIVSRLSLGFRLPIFISHQDGTFYTDVVTTPRERNAPRRGALLSDNQRISDVKQSPPKKGFII